MGAVSARQAGTTEARQPSHPLVGHEYERAMVVVPVSSHGAGGTLTQVEGLSAIIDGTETNRAPEQRTHRFNQGPTERSLPCAKPAGTRGTALPWHNPAARCVGIL